MASLPLSLSLLNSTSPSVYHLSCLSQVCLSSAPISNSLLGLSLASSTTLSVSFLPVTPDPQSPRSTPEYSESPRLSRLPLRPHLSLSLGLPCPSLRAPPSLHLPPARGCGCHIAACGAPGAADSAFPRPRLGARSRRAVPARPPPALAHPHLPPPSPARLPALTTSEADLAGPGSGPGAAVAPPSRVPRARTPPPGRCPGRAPPAAPPPPAPAHSPSAAPTTKASSVPMAALRALRPPPGPPVLIAGQEAAGPGGG